MVRKRKPAADSLDGIVLKFGPAPKLESIKAFPAPKRCWTIIYQDKILGFMAQMNDRTYPRFLGDPFNVLWDTEGKWIHAQNLISLSTRNRRIDKYTTPFQDIFLEAVRYFTSMA